MSDRMKTWDGKNKQYVRLVKAKYAVDYLSYKKGLARCLTLPGSHGYMEKILVSAKITIPLKITGVERDLQYISMLHRNAGELRGMELLHGDLQKINIEKSKFDLLDIDMCGCFSQKNREIFRQLTKNLSRKGVFCVTLEKGREKDVYNQLDFYKRVPSNTQVGSNLLSFYTQILTEVIKGNASLKDAGRIFTVPSFYIATAQKQGYNFVLQKLIEYNDNPPNMYQYIYTFSKSKAPNRAGINSIKEVWEEYLSIHKQKPRSFIGKIYESHIGERNENSKTKNTQSLYKKAVDQEVWTTNY